MRLFLAVEIPEKIKKEISLINLKDFTGKIVEKENLHVNIKFFGEIPSPNRIIDKLSSIKFEPIKIKINGFNVFPNKNTPQVLHLIVESKQLLEVHKKIEEKLQNFDSRKYTPHITLMRIKSQDSPSLIFEKEFTAEFETKEITLFKSELLPTGPVYEKIYVMKST